MSIAKHQSPNANPVTREHVETITRLVLEGLSDKEIALKMGWSVNRVRIALLKNKNGRKAIKAGK